MSFLLFLFISLAVVLGLLFVVAALAALIAIAIALLPVVFPALLTLAAFVLALLVIGYPLFLLVRWTVTPSPMPPAVYGLANLGNLPTLPWIPLAYIPAAMKLLDQQTQREQAFQGLTEEIEIGGGTQRAHALLQPGENWPDSLTQTTAFDLERPEQFSIGWTAFGDLDRKGLAPAPDGSGRTLKQYWSDSLSDPEEGTRQFWPTIARYAIPYNPVILRKVPSDEDLDTLLDRFFVEDFEDDARTATIAARDENRLFIIDLSIFDQFPPGTGSRFTPATTTLLRRAEDDPASPILPFAIAVKGQDPGEQIYKWMPDIGPADDPDRWFSPAWLYALQAAKTSITVYGIWLGHVYHFHLPTSTMQMTMFNMLPPLHGIRQILTRQSDHLIGFDQFLLTDVLYNISPPTSFDTPRSLIDLWIKFAEGRSFFDDDLFDALDANNLSASDFSVDGATDDFLAEGDFNAFPVLWLYHKVWDACDAYADATVSVFYSTDGEVASDGFLGNWIESSRAGTVLGIGNVSGLPQTPLDLDGLKKIVRSLIYRITVHGFGRLLQSAHPAITFAANFPPCLKSTNIPSPFTPFVFSAAQADGDLPDGTDELANYLPDTITIGLYITFLYTFAFTPPRDAFVPTEGIEAEPTHPFTDVVPLDQVDQAAELRNALVTFREAIIDAVRCYSIEVYKSETITVIAVDPDDLDNPVDPATDNNALRETSGRFPDWAPGDTIRVRGLPDNESDYEIVARTDDTLVVNGTLADSTANGPVRIGLLRPDSSGIFQWPLNIEL